MGLNRLNKIVLNFNKKSVKNIPDNKDDLDNILHYLLEIFDDLIYEDRKENNNRHPLYAKNVKVHSIIKTIQDLSKYKYPKDKQDYRKGMNGILVKLESVEYSIKKIKSSVKKITKDIDKK